MCPVGRIWKRGTLVSFVHQAFDKGCCGIPVGLPYAVGRMENSGLDQLLCQPDLTYNLACGTHLVACSHEQRSGVGTHREPESHWSQSYGLHFPDLVTKLLCRLRNVGVPVERLRLDEQSA